LGDADGRRDEKVENSIMKIVHLSDIHASGPDFIAQLGDNVIKKVNEVRPELLVVTGDLTDDGYSYEYERALSYLDQLEASHKVVVPGNHDARNVGYVNFEAIFGTRFPVFQNGELTLVGIDSSDPDIDDGRIGRGSYEFMQKKFNNGAGLRILALHHHLVPIPGTGRERNIPVDAGDVLKLLMDLKVQLVLSGHKHIPWCWRLENTFLVTAGTATTNRLKGRSEASFNLIEIHEERLDIVRISSDGLTETRLLRIPKSQLTL